MIVRISKWGNSHALRIPHSIVEHFQLDVGSELDLSLRQGRIVLVPQGRDVLDIDTLVAGITPGNAHGELDWGKRSRRETPKPARSRRATR